MLGRARFGLARGGARIGRWVLGVVLRVWGGADWVRGLVGRVLGLAGLCCGMGD